MSWLLMKSTSDARLVRRKDLFVPIKAMSNCRVICSVKCNITAAVSSSEDVRAVGCKPCQPMLTLCIDETKLTPQLLLTRMVGVTPGQSSFVTHEKLFSSLSFAELQQQQSQCAFIVPLH